MAGLPCSLNPATQRIVSEPEMAQHQTDGLNPYQVQIASLKEPSPDLLYLPESEG